MTPRRRAGKVHHPPRPTSKIYFIRQRENDNGKERKKGNPKAPQAPGAVAAATCYTTVS